MVETTSNMLPLGTHIPEFNLQDAVTGELVSPGRFEGKAALLVMFLCNHCPFVVHVRDALGPLAQEYQDCGLGVVAINSNSRETHPQDGPERMKELVAEMGWNFPFLFDSTQEIAKAFRAACTPDFYVFDGNQELVYRGRLDDSRPGNDLPVTGKDLREALDALLEGRPAPEIQRPSIGCNIKWTPGNEPDYF